VTLFNIFKCVVAYLQKISSATALKIDMQIENGAAINRA